MLLKDARRIEGSPGSLGGSGNWIVRHIDQLPFYLTSVGSRAFRGRRHLCRSGDKFDGL
jgi:hypothetical protein